MEGYIIAGKLFGIDLPGEFNLHRSVDETGAECDSLFTEIRKSSDTDVCGFTEYYIYDGVDRILLPDGGYEVIIGDKSYPLMSLVSYHVTEEGKKTVNKRNSQNEGRKISFCDSVYPVILNAGQVNVEFKITGTGESVNAEKWPKILEDGVMEKAAIGGEEINYSITYGKEWNSNEPQVFQEFPIQPDPMFSLDHMDKLEVVFSGKIVKTFYWDQISKVWFEQINFNCYQMHPVEGGTYTMGDWRGKQYNFSFGKANTNMKKKWKNVMDPQYMNESGRGEEAVGVQGLREEDSLTATDKENEFWCYNDDAITLHRVKLTDFELGDYQVTMEQYYMFVDALKADSPSEISYEIKGQRIYINEIAARTLYYKMKCVRDNGWGKGQRPVIDVAFFEIVEFCNWMSRKEELPVCYEIRPIYQGEYKEGKIKANFFLPVEGSCMQKRLHIEEEVQMYEVTCDFHKNGYRLPTEAEFEYVIRGGKYIPEINGGHGSLFAGISSVGLLHNDDYSWQRKNVDNPQKNEEDEADLARNNMGANGYTNPVGTKLPNQLGFYDLSGNVWETMWDWFSFDYYDLCKEKGTVTDPKGPVYTKEQMCNFNDANVDKTLQKEYLYTYQKEEDGTYIRTSAHSISNAGKTVHILRGGCHTNPYPFTTSLHRHSVTATSYYTNVLNYSNARIGFRMARTVLY